ncbi:MAG: S9 family peptidase [Deltaproteobacteria bacterium]|nr:S9 family peptidase [Deltaproteobacteria bacterium]
MTRPIDADESIAPPLIPRELLFGNPDRWQPTLSPDGRRMAWLAPDVRGVRQVWVRTLDVNDECCVTNDHHRGISFYGWAWDSKTVCYIQDSDGDENFHLFAVDLATGNVRDLTPWQGVRCEFVAANVKYPDQVLMALNVRDRKKMDVWRINLVSGEALFDTENPGDIVSWLADDNLIVRGATALTEQGTFQVRVRDGNTAPWRAVARPGPNDEVAALGFSKDGSELYLKSSIGNETLRIVGKNLKTGDEREIANRPGLDAEQVLIHPINRAIEAVAFEPGRREWVATDATVAGDFEALSRVEDGDFSLAGRDAADSRWIIKFDGDCLPAKYYLWDRSARRARFIFSSQSKLESYRFVTTKPIRYRARDGMELHGYLTLPSGIDGKLPMVLLVHGGPWARDYWGFNGYVQLLANRGYAVLQPNYRGSTGYGKRYLHAGDLQWGRAMQNDLTDAVKWAVVENIADPGHIAICGASYGGYAALAGAAFTPELYCCAVDIVGPSSLFTLLASFPPYWAPYIQIFKQRMGNPDKPSDRDMLRNVSPLFSADRIRIPLLIAQGANDPRVTQLESEQIVAAIEKNGGAVTYVLYPDEGHGFVRPANIIDFVARTEKFLAEHLGGRYEPMTEDRIAGSTAVVRVIGD